MAESLPINAQPEPGTGGAPRPEFCRFRCWLDDQPDHLVPRRLLQAFLERGLMERPLRLNESCRRVPPYDPPEQLQERPWMLEAISRKGEMLWLEDPETISLLPFWIGEELAATLDRLHCGSLKVWQLPERTRLSLAWAGILVPEAADARDCGWAETANRCLEKFRADGYGAVAGLIHPFHISAMRGYYRRRIRSGEFKLGDTQSARRYVAYDEPVASFFHHQLTNRVSGLAGELLKPSYCYFGSYQAGAVLDKHIDREQCAVSVTLCLDYSPEPAHETAWPIHLHPRSGKTTVYQGLGDGLLYRGCELPHSRDRIPEGHTSTSIFFHYVPASFSGPLH